MEWTGRLAGYRIINKNMFGKKEVKLSESQIEKLNSLLVDELKKEVWTTNDFKGDYSIYSKVYTLKTNVTKLVLLSIYHIQKHDHKICL